MRAARGALPLVTALALLASACGTPASPSTAGPATDPAPATARPSASPVQPVAGRGSARPSPSPSRRAAVPRAGNPAGRATVPAEARAEDTSRPTRTIGTGTAASCTSRAVVAAVAAGGVIRFSCGPRPVTIRMEATAKVRNANGPRIVLDGGGLVTLSGGGRRRILYLNTCDPAQGYTTSHC